MTRRAADPDDYMTEDEKDYWRFSDDVWQRGQDTYEAQMGLGPDDL